MEIDEWKSLEQSWLASCIAAELSGRDSFGISSVTVGERQLNVHLAHTSWERKLGLMFRDADEVGDGMLFSWAQPVRAEFHMQNVRVPLHIYWFDADGACLASRPLLPDDPTRHTSMTPFRYALEVPLHVAESLGQNPRLRLS